MFSSDRQELRKLFFTTWQKFKNNLPLETLEQQLLNIILQHSEYHALLENPEKYLDKDFAHENPFMHMSLHLAIHEQTSTDRPHGIKKIFEELSERFKNPHEIEHQFMEVLAEIIWQAQHNGIIPDEKNYLQRLNELLLL